MIGRPNLQSRVRHDDDARYHGGDRIHPVLGCIWHETDSERWDGRGGTREYLNGGSKKASYNYVILDDGTIVRFTPPRKVAWHAGKHCTAGPAQLRLDDSVNGTTVGVCWVNRVARGFPLSHRQLESGLWLGSVLQEQYGYDASMNFGHREVAPTWKSDPMAEHLDMHHWRHLLALGEWPAVITPRETDLCASHT